MEVCFDVTLSFGLSAANTLIFFPHLYLEKLFKKDIPSKFENLLENKNRYKSDSEFRNNNVLLEHETFSLFFQTMI